MKPQVTESTHPPVIETLIALNARFVVLDTKVFVQGDMNTLNRIKGHLYRKHGVKGTLTPSGMLQFYL